MSSKAPGISSFNSSVSRRGAIQGIAGIAGGLAVTGFGSDIVSAHLIPAAQAGNRGTLVIRSRAIPENYNPLLADVRVWLYDGLVRFDADMNIVPDLANPGRHRKTDWSTRSC